MEEALIKMLLVGVPLREMVERFGLQVVQLFKLILLQKRVLFFHSPVRPLSTAILSLLALFPGLVETGLDSATALAAPLEGTAIKQANETNANQEQLPSPGRILPFDGEFLKKIKNSCMQKVA